MPKIHTNGIDIYYEITGYRSSTPAEPLVLIAGIGYDRWMWHKMLPLLARDFLVVAFDNRGVGQSDQPLGPYTAQLLADDTAGLIEGLGVARAAVMGHSMGGFIAQALALRRPDLVDQLILSATNFGGPHHVPITPEAMAVLTDISGDPVARVKRGLEVSVAPGFAEAHPEVVQEWIAYRLDHPIQPAAYQSQLAIGLGLLSAENSFENRLKTIQAPTLILFGEHDKVVPPANADLLSREIPNCRVVILPGVGHFFPIEAPAAAAEVVTQFIHQPSPK